MLIVPSCEVVLAGRSKLSRTCAPRVSSGTSARARGLVRFVRCCSFVL